MSDAEKPESFGFDFAPAWARGSADEYVSRYQGKNYDERTGREERPRRERPPRQDRDGEPRGRSPSSAASPSSRSTRRSASSRTRRTSASSSRPFRARTWPSP